MKYSERRYSSLRHSIRYKHWTIFEHTYVQTATLDQSARPPRVALNNIYSSRDAWCPTSTLVVRALNVYSDSNARPPDNPPPQLYPEPNRMNIFRPHVRWPSWRVNPHPLQYKYIMPQWKWVTGENECPVVVVVVGNQERKHSHTRQSCPFMVNSGSSQRLIHS